MRDIAYGESCVIIDKRHNNKWVVVLEEGGSLHTHLGEIQHKTIYEIGYGGTIELNEKLLHIRKLTLEEHTKTLKRRVTPIYPKDMGRISTLMDVRPGDRVLEAGTGTGCMTLHLARCVGRDGEVWSFEKRSDFHRSAKNEISQWALESSSIKLFQGDLVENCTVEDGFFDSMFLDLSDTGPVLEKTLRFVKNGGSIVILLLQTTQMSELERYIRENDLDAHWETVVELSERTWVVKDPICRPKSFETSVHTGFLIHLVKANRSNVRLSSQ